MSTSPLYGPGPQKLIEVAFRNPVFAIGKTLNRFHTTRQNCELHRLPNGDICIRALDMNLPKETRRVEYVAAANVASYALAEV